MFSKPRRGSLKPCKHGTFPTGGRAKIPPRKAFPRYGAHNQIAVISQGNLVPIYNLFKSSLYGPPATQQFRPHHLEPWYLQDGGYAMRPKRGRLLMRFSKTLCGHHRALMVEQETPGDFLFCQYFPREEVTL